MLISPAVAAYAARMEHWSKAGHPQDPGRGEEWDWYLRWLPLRQRINSFQDVGQKERTEPVRLLIEQWNQKGHRYARIRERERCLRGRALR